MPVRVLLIAAAVVVVAAATSAVAAVRYDRQHDDRLAAGILIAGVDVGGLSVAQARAKLTRQVVGPLQRPVKVTVGQRTFTLPTRQVRLRVDVDDALTRALELSREGGLVHRVKRRVLGGRVDAQLTLRPRFDRRQVSRFVARLKERVDVDARDAELRFTTAALTETRSRRGTALRAAELRRRITKDLDTLQPTRAVRGSTQPRRPQVSTSDLADRYPVVVTVDRASNRLRLFKRLELVKSYPVSVGEPRYPTPAGLYSIVNKQVDPAWHVPQSDWAGALAGKVIPGGSPQNPLKARWMGITGAVGIHGTAEESRIGGAASHGCIRMRVADVKDLYERVPVGAPVFIS